MIQPGTLLTDAKSQNSRFRVKSLLQEGKHYQIALGEDTQMDDKKVCLKTIDYPVDLMESAEYVQGRRLALEAELKFLTHPSPMLPEPMDMLYLSGSPLGDLEPVLVYEYIQGDTLYDYIKKRFPRGMPPVRALAILRELVQFATDIHASGYVFRDFDPRHIIIGLDEVVQVVGCGNAVVKGEKMNVFKMNTSLCYTAPEIRKEISGKVVREACDTYSLGCLMSFMLTASEPRPMAEAPLDHDVYDYLRQQIPVGYKLLIARCLQPLAQKRFVSASEMLQYCTPETLPTPATEGFGLVELPAPWEGPEGMDNRALRSKISPGPLVSEKHKEEPVAQEQVLATTAEDALEKPSSDRSKKKTALIVGLIASLLLFLGLIVIGVIVAAMQ